MESSLVHIAISTNALASLIESGSIHAEDFKCLNADSKKTVWTLFLSALKATTTSKREHRGQIIMSDNENQEVLLMAIEYLKIQYADLRNPCIALYISRYYRLLSELNSIQNRQASYAQHSQSWLNCHTANAGYSQKMQMQLNDFVTLHESN
jgi:hypothetical protein